MNTKPGHSTTKRDAAVMALAAAAAVFAAGERDARACGACYAGASESTVVNDHRMALKVSPQETILWDQISYTGNPREFAYVIPVKPGTRLEASKEAWFASLDATTRPIIMQPNTGGGYSGGEGGGGCACGSSDAMSAMASESGGGNGEGVKVVSQAVVGPYETVTLRATDPRALQNWLTQNGFAIPDIAGPIVDQYVADGFDFIALRLAPGKDVRSMEPIRIRSAGGDAKLPLRMMQIGAGAKLGITLYVVSEGRYRTANFPERAIDVEKLIWDFAQNRSNYQELSQSTMAASEGRTFLVEFADKANLVATGQPISPGMVSNPSLTDAYTSLCVPSAARPPSPVDASTGGDAARDDGRNDAGNDAGDDAGDDAGATTTPPPPPPTPRTTRPCDDLEVALDGMHDKDLWITRLRANLPNAALAETLRLEPAVQERVEHIHFAKEAGTITQARIARVRAGRYGGVALACGAALLVSRILRRRRRRQTQL